MADTTEKTALPTDTLLLPQPEPVNNVAISLPEYDWEEILKHDKPRDLWMAVGGNVYNVGEFMFYHPGGADIYLKNHGKDATAEFLKAGHPAYAMALTASFLIGKVKPGSKPPLVVGGGGKCPFPHEAMAAAAGGTTAAAKSRPGDDGLIDIPVAVPELKMKGERFLNFDILNNGLSQLDYYKQFGHVYQVPLPGRKGRIVVVSDPVLLDEVADNSEQFGKQVEGINFFTQLQVARGAGISVVSDSPFYEKVRRMMIPWYSPQHQRTQFPRMMQVARDTMAAWDEIPDETPLDMRDWATRYALEISGRGACNYDFKVLDPNAQRSEFARAVPECLKEAVARVAEAAPDKCPFFGGEEQKKRSEKFHHQSQVLFETANQIVDTRLHTVPSGEQTDLLSRLISVKDPETDDSLTPDVIRDQVLMHLSNGFNGPSVTLSWLTHVLATHPEVQAKVVAEIDSITGGDPDYELQYADLMAMKYITQVIKETLRIYPPMPVTIRNSLKDGRLGDYRMHKGDIIFVGSLAAQRDTRYWGDRPDTFDPEHFTVEKIATRPRHAFIPFSVGVRQCMAQEVTFMMLRVGIFHIWNKYRVRMAPGAKVVQRAVVTMGPVTVDVVREKREGKATRQAQLTIARAKAAAKIEVVDRSEEKIDRSWDVPCEIAETSPYKRALAAFGSNFGVCKDLAGRLTEKSAKFGFEAEALPLNNFIDRFQATKPQLLFLVTATYTGNPPSNANKFKAWLQEQKPGPAWKDCRFVLWGLGNSQWNAFMAFPRFVFKRLQELGATPLIDLGIGDVSTPAWQDAFARWNDQVWPRVIDIAGARPSDAAAAKFNAHHRESDELKSMDSAAAIGHSVAGRLVAPSILSNALDLETHRVSVLVSRELHAPGSKTSTRHIEVTLPDGFNYTSGDHLGVCPQNSKRQVERLSALLEAPLDAVFMVPKSMDVRAVPRDTVLQVRNVLTSLVDIGAAPSLPLVSALAECCAVEDEREVLAEMRDVLAGRAESPALLEQLRGGRYDVVELLDRFRGCKLNFFKFLELVLPLRPRYYSTSSCPEIHGEGSAHVSVGRLVKDIPGEPPDGGRRFHGLSSNFIHSLKEGDAVDIFLDAAEGFHIQEDMSRPMIMVSAGTGYAPMRAFLFERLARKRRGVPMGEAVLFNGIRKSSDDYIYRDELEMFGKEGVLDHLHVAMSREVPGKVEYVQHKILEQSKLSWELIQQGAFIYVCGSQQMRNDVQAAFVKCIQDEGKMSAEAAAEYMKKMETDTRYRPDVWG